MFIKSGLQKCSSEIIKADLNSAIEDEQSDPKVVKKFRCKLLIQKKASIPSRGEEKWESQVEFFGNLALAWKKPTHYYITHIR